MFSLNTSDFIKRPQIRYLRGKTQLLFWFQGISVLSSTQRHKDLCDHRDVTSLRSVSPSIYGREMKGFPNVIPCNLWWLMRCLLMGGGTLLLFHILSFSDNYQPAGWSLPLVLWCCTSQVISITYASQRHWLMYEVSTDSAEKGKWKKILEQEKPQGGVGERPRRIEEGRNKLASLVM